MKERMTTEEMIEATKSTLELFSAMRQTPGRRFIISTDHDKMLGVHAELVRRKHDEQAKDGEAQAAQEGGAA